MEWTKILEFFINQGVLGIIGYIFLKSYTKKEKQNSDNFQLLIRSVLDSNKENINELKRSIDKLIVVLDKRDKMYENILEDIVDEVAKLKEKYIEVSSQISTMIYEEKCLSGNGFYEICKQIINIHVYKALIDIICEIDKNGFDEPKQIDLLKINIPRALERRHGEGVSDISLLNYNESKKEKFLKTGHKMYEKYMKQMNDEIINQININDLQGDKNYIRLKSLIKAKLFEYSDAIIKLLGEVIKK